MSNKKEQQSTHLVKGGIVWDLPLRVFHWTLVATTIGAIISSKLGVMFWHEKMGLTILGLVGFRVIWGFVGSYHARFKHFMVGPKAVLRYVNLRRDGDKTYHPGHAPTGAYATVLILLVFGVMAILGTMSNNDILYEGPLAAYVGDFTHDASDYHHIMERAVFLMIFLHLLAMIIYRIALKINLIPPMVHGGRDATVSPPSLKRQVIGIFVLVGMVAAAQSLGLLGDRFF